MRKIATGLYTQVAKDCLESVLGQLSDGRWESVPSMAKYWIYASISCDPDCQVIINVADESWVSRDYGRYGNGFYGKSDFDVMRFFADKIKQIVKEEFKGLLEEKLLWNRDCKRKTDWISCYGHPDIEVRDAYLVYESLKGRSRAKGKYSADVVSKVIGVPLTSEMIEARKKIKEIQAKRDDELNTAKFEYEKICTDIKSKYEEELQDLRKIAGC